MMRSAVTRFLFIFLAFTGAGSPGVLRGETDARQESREQSSVPQLPADLARQIVQKVLSEARSGKIVPYDITSEAIHHQRYNNPPPCDEGDEECWSKHPYYGMMSGGHGGYKYFCHFCKAARLRLRHQEYMLVAWYDDHSWLICDPEDFSKCRPAIDQGLSIYECSPRKKPPHETENLPCIYGDRYKDFSDDDADGSLDTLAVMNKGTEYVYDFEDGTVCRELLDYEFDCWAEKEDQRKINPADKRRFVRKYERLLGMIAKEYGIFGEK